jgi:hypothetical protein
MKPENRDYEEVQRALKDARPPVDAELRHDLWPAMLRRIQEQPAPSVPWYDWALAAGVLATIVVFPKAALLFAYHL